LLNLILVCFTFSS